MQSFHRILKCLFSFAVLSTHPVFSRMSQRIFLRVLTLHWEGVWNLICTPCVIRELFLSYRQSCRRIIPERLASSAPRSHSGIPADHCGNNSAEERRWFFLWLSCIQWLGRTPARAFMLKLGPNQWVVSPLTLEPSLAEWSSWSSCTVHSTVYKGTAAPKALAFYQRVLDI